MHTGRQRDGASSDDGLTASACGPGHVDVSRSRHPQDVLHVWADDFAAFARDIKAGKYDHLCPPEGSHLEETNDRPRLRGPAET